MAEFIYNNKQYSSIEKSIFFINLEKHWNIYRKRKKLAKKISEVIKFVYFLIFRLRIKSWHNIIYDSYKQSHNMTLCYIYYIL